MAFHSGEATLYIAGGNDLGGTGLWGGGITQYQSRFCNIAIGTGLREAGYLAPVRNRWWDIANAQAPLLYEGTIALNSDIDGDNVYATVDTFYYSASAGNYFTEFLYAHDFQFSIPSNSDIHGIKFIVKKKREGPDFSIGVPGGGPGPAPHSGTLYDYKLHAVRDGIPVFSYNGKRDGDWGTTFVRFEYPPNSLGTWGTTWTPELINDNKFGLLFATRGFGRVSTVNGDYLITHDYGTGVVDSIEAIVSYTEYPSDPSIPLYLHNPDRMLMCQTTGTRSSYPVDINLTFIPEEELVTGDWYPYPNFGSYPSNLLHPFDGAYIEANLLESFNIDTTYLVGNDFRFNIPLNATIKSIVFTVEKSVTHDVVEEEAAVVSDFQFWHSPGTNLVAGQPFEENYTEEEWPYYFVPTVGLTGWICNYTIPSSYLNTTYTAASLAEPSSLAILMSATADYTTGGFNVAKIGYLSCRICYTAPPYDDIPLYTEGAIVSDNNITLYTEGDLPSTGSLPLFTHGIGWTPNQITLTLNPQNRIVQGLDLFTNNGNSSGDKITLSTYGIEDVLNQAITLHISVPTSGQEAQGLSLYIPNGRPVNSDLFFYLDSPSSTGDSDSGKPLTLFGSIYNDNGITFYIQAPSSGTHSDKIFLFLDNDTISYTGSIPLFLSNAPFSGNIPLYIHQTGTPTDGDILLFIRRPIIEAVPLFIRGHETATSSTPLYLEAAWLPKNNEMPLFMKSRELFALDSEASGTPRFPLFLQVNQIGSGLGPNSGLPFYEGNALTLPLFMHSPVFWSDFSLFLKNTGESIGSPLTLDIAGEFIHLDNNLQLFVRNSGDNYYIPLSISGQGFSSSENAQRSRDSFIPYENNTNLFLRRPITDVTTMFIRDTYTSGGLGFYMSAAPISETGIQLSINGLGYTPVNLKLYSHGF